MWQNVIHDTEAKVTVKIIYLIEVLRNKHVSITMKVVVSAQKLLVAGPDGLRAVGELISATHLSTAVYEHGVWFHYLLK